MSNKQGNFDQLKKFYKPDPEKIWFTSDLHFFHSNIIKWCSRPFLNSTHMNEVLIENWNSVVPEDGIVYVLGDFMMGGDHHDWMRIRNKLNGTIILIRGNHDFKENSQNKLFLESIFDLVLFQMRARIENTRVWMSHFPPLCYSGSDTSSISLFGHVHTMNNGKKNIGTDFPRLCHLLPSQYDVGCDFNNYTPISWAKIKERVDFQRKHNVNMLFWINQKKEISQITDWDIIKFKIKNKFKQIIYDLD